MQWGQRDLWEERSGWFSYPWAQAPELTAEGYTGTWNLMAADRFAGEADVQHGIPILLFGTCLHGHPRVQVLWSWEAGNMRETGIPLEVETQVASPVHIPTPYLSVHRGNKTTLTSNHNCSHWVTWGSHFTSMNLVSSSVKMSIWGLLLCIGCALLGAVLCLFKRTTGSLHMLFPLHKMSLALFGLVVSSSSFRSLFPLPFLREIFLTLSTKTKRLFLLYPDMPFSCHFTFMIVVI